MLVVSYRDPDTNTNNNTLWCVNPPLGAGCMFPQHSVHMWHIFTCDTCHVWHILTSSPDQVASCLITRDTDRALHHHCSYTSHIVTPWSPSDLLCLSVPVCSRWLSWSANGRCFLEVTRCRAGEVRVDTNTGWMRWRRGYCGLQQFLHIHISWPHRHQPLRLISSRLPPLSLVLSNAMIRHVNDS